jgi:hypothetical protein
MNLLINIEPIYERCQFAAGRIGGEVFENRVRIVFGVSAPGGFGLDLPARYA